MASAATPAWPANSHINPAGGTFETGIGQWGFSHGYADEYWILDRISQLIWQLFAVRYHLSAVWHLLRRISWSCQRLQRRPIGRDDGAVLHWRHYVWPHIKKWRELHATLVFEDESGHSLVSPLKRTRADPLCSHQPGPSRAVELAGGTVPYVRRVETQVQ